MKKLVIKAELALPEDDFEAARILAQLQSPIGHFREALAGGTVEHQIITARGPHKKPAPPLHPMAVVRSSDDAA